MSGFANAADGTRLSYDDEGSGPTVVLVHGFAANRAITWRNTGWYSALTGAGRRVLAFDCRGHGQSGKPHDAAAYADPVMASDILAVMDAADVRDADLMGYSMGGYMTMNLLHASGGRIRKAVVAGVGETYFHFWQERSEVIAQGLEAPDAASLTEPLAIEFRTFAERARNDLPALAACMRRQRLALTREQIGRIANPVLVVCGEEDPIAGRPDPLAQVFAHGRAATVPKRNHHSTVGDPRYKEAVKAFLSDQT